MKRFSKKDEEEAKLFFNNNGFVIIEDVFNEEFLTPSIDFQYRGMTPKEFYDHKFS